MLAAGVLLTVASLLPVIFVAVCGCFALPGWFFLGILKVISYPLRLVWSKGERTITPNGSRTMEEELALILPDVEPDKKKEQPGTAKMKYGPLKNRGCEPYQTDERLLKDWCQWASECNESEWDERNGPAPSTVLRITVAAEAKGRSILSEEE